MDDVTNSFPNAPFDAERAARDPEYRKQLDDEDRKYDDASDGIDWDEIIATTHEDFDAGDYAFCSGDYPTWDAAMAALKRSVEEVIKESRRVEPAQSSAHAARA